MLRQAIRFFSILFFCSTAFCVEELGVTYDFSGGRFGDNLLSYLHAKWFAYQHQIPLYYKPFLFSSHLVLHDQERKIEELNDVNKWRHFLDRGPFYSRTQQPVLYICPYFPEDLWEQKNTQSLHGGPWLHIQVDWSDPEFKKVVQTLVAPNHDLTLITPPANCINIAIHIREGGGHDDQLDLEEGSRSNPMKFPPISFYAEGLKAVLELVRGKPLHCHLFTDAQYPEAIASLLQSYLPKEESLVFTYREKNNRHYLNVLEDFFSFFKFDVLIRSQSNYSMAASLIHDFAIVYSPKDCRVQEEGVVITEIDFKINQKKLDESSLRVLRQNL